MKARIGFAGMTHLGLNSAAASAERGFEVTCFDPDSELIQRLQAGELPIHEPGLAELMERNRRTMEFTAEVGALERCDVVLISADVPTDGRGESNLGVIRTLIGTVTAGLSRDATLVVLCQVPPGFTRGLLFEKRRLYYQVETLIFGRAVDRALSPERFIVGCAMPEDPPPAPYAEYLKAFGCPVLPMRYESAELAKISINCFLVAQVSVTNTLAELSEKIGADWSEIAPALRLDRRIGPHAYLAPGLGIAGGNLERDLATVVRLAQGVGTDACVIDAFSASSRHRADWALGILHSEVLTHKPDATVAVLGLAYKENTHSTKNSPSLALIAHLTPFRLALFDPEVSASAVAHPAARAARSALDAANGADVLAIMTPWPEFAKLDPGALAHAMVGRIVIDPYRVLNSLALASAGFDYHTLGAPPFRSGPARSGNPGKPHA